MNSHDAKQFLQTCTLEGFRPDDPQLAAALEQTRRDPALLAWFNQQRALDEAIATKLAQTPVPAGLAGRIISGRKVRRQAQRRRVLLPLALAASLALLFGLLVFVQDPARAPQTEFAILQRDMTRFLVTFPDLELTTDRWPSILQWLGEKPGLQQAQIPVHLQRFPALGCRVVRWRGKELMLVCFAAQGEVVHLFVLPSAIVAGVPATSQLALSDLDGWSAGCWNQEGVTYLALTRGNRDFLQRLLAEMG
jgi:hypothetical protein